MKKFEVAKDNFFLYGKNTTPQQYGNRHNTSIPEREKQSENESKNCNNIQNRRSLLIFEDDWHLYYNGTD